MTKRTKMMVIAVATLMLTVFVMGCSDNMTNPIDGTAIQSRNANQEFNFRVTAILQVTPENGTEPVETDLFSVESVNGVIENPPALILPEGMDALQVTEGDVVTVWFEFMITNDRGTPQLATWVGDVIQHEFDGKKGEAYAFPVTVVTDVVAPQAEFVNEVELWVRKGHPNFAQLLWGAAQNTNIIIEVLPKPVTEYEEEFYFDETIISEAGKDVTLKGTGNGMEVGMMVVPPNQAAGKIRLFIKNDAGLNLSIDNTSPVSAGKVAIENSQFKGLADGKYTYVIETDFYRHNSGKVEMIDDVVEITIYLVQGKIVGNGVRLVEVTK